jgi:hypothetical protein
VEPADKLIPELVQEFISVHDVIDGTLPLALLSLSSRACRRLTAHDRAEIVDGVVQDTVTTAVDNGMSEATERLQRMIAAA